MKEEQHKIYKGYELRAINIFWTRNLGKAWQCNFGKNIYYASTPEEVFDQTMKHIDAITHNDKI